MTDEILGEARKYVSRGWVVHPLSDPCVGNSTPPTNAGKRPLESSWQNLNCPSDEQLIKWFKNTNNNIGLVCGKKSGITIIDLDKLDWLSSLIPPKEIDISKTLMSGRTTGRGHIYFKYDPELKNLKLHELGIEILSDGSNAVLPPSTHQ